MSSDSSIANKDGTKQYQGGGGEAQAGHRGRYTAEIRVRRCKEKWWLGAFNTAEQAAFEYDIAARALRGYKAWINFPSLSAIPHGHVAPGHGLMGHSDDVYCITSVEHICLAQPHILLLIHTTAMLQAVLFTLFFYGSTREVQSLLQFHFQLVQCVCVLILVEALQAQTLLASFHKHRPDKCNYISGVKWHCLEHIQSWYQQTRISVVPSL